MAGMNREMTRIYEARRDKALLKQDLRQKEAFSKIPALATLDAQIGEVGVHYARAALAGDDNAAKNLTKALQEMKSEKQSLLIGAGYISNWLEPWWLCPLCHDSGYVDDTFNGLRHLCACGQQMHIAQLFRSSNLNNDRTVGFGLYTDRYYPDAQNPEEFGIAAPVKQHMSAVFQRLQQFIEVFQEEGTKSLFFHGPTGTGKTFMAKSIGKALIEKGHTVLYLSATDFFEAARAAKFYDGEKEDSIAAYRKVLQCELLILDDLGTEPASDSRYADLLMLLETRAQKKNQPTHTIIATNMDIRRLYAVYNERIGSRIVGEFDDIPFAGSDIRVLKRLES